MSTTTILAAALIAACETEKACEIQLAAVTAEAKATAGAEPGDDATDAEWSAYEARYARACTLHGVDSVRDRYLIAERDIVRALRDALLPAARLAHRESMGTVTLCDQILGGRTNLIALRIVLKNAKAIAAKAVRS